MHPYATDSSERKSIPFLLASLAIISAWLLPRLLMRMTISVPWWIDAPSVMGFYGLFHFGFDRWAWRWPIFRTMGLVRVLDLSGYWTASIVSSYRSGEVVGKVRIRQNWRSISISLATPQSRSSSRVASLLVDDPNECVLHYEYLNTPRHSAADTMHMHRGSAEIRLQRNNGELIGEGEYFSGRDRANHGTIHLERSFAVDQTEKSDARETQENGRTS
jgi:hypothetical protein